MTPEFKEFNLRTQSRKRSSSKVSFEHEPAPKHFKAKEMPDFSKVKEIRPVSRDRSIEQVPFNLATSERKRQSESVIEQEEEVPLFRARKLPTSTSKAHLIQPLPKEGTKFTPFKLASMQRAQERQDFELKTAERLKTEEARREAELKEQERQEEQARAEFRKQSVFKATPIKLFKQASAPISDRELTVPSQPSLRTAERAKLKET